MTRGRYVKSIDLIVAGFVYDYNPGRVIVIRSQIALAVGVEMSSVTVAVVAGSVTLQISIIAESYTASESVGETLRLRFLSPHTASLVFGGDVDVLSVSPVRASTTTRIVWSVPMAPPLVPPPPPASPPLPTSPPLTPPSLPPLVIPWSASTIAAVTLGSLAAVLIAALCLGIFARTVRSSDSSVAPAEGSMQDVFAAAAAARAARGGISERQIEVGTLKARGGSTLSSARPLRIQHLQGEGEIAMSREDMGRYLRGDWRDMYYGS